ncbi:MAG: Na+/H+ antiporter subunit E [Austwickia sp.]|nr:Na+/H+ antiporter subunit E [Actinomycetota bacterium]MCB1253450.1 Na+/H+ antiporter subunit E [Austwickia sp.]MCO5310370.1 Na+/H+ antiporter subunit E [Austwickia sp.]
MSRRRSWARPRLLPLLALTLLWTALFGDWSVGNTVAGLLLATLILVLFPMPPVIAGLRLHPVGAVILVARFLVDVVVASLEVAYKAVAPWYRPAGRFLRVPLRGTSDLTRVITAELCSLVPGSLVVDLDPETGVLMLHIFDAPTPQRLAAAVRRVHEQERRVLRALSASEVVAR